MRFLFVKHCTVHETHLYLTPFKLPFKTLDLTISLATYQILQCCLYVKINCIVGQCYSVFLQPFAFESTVYGPCVGEDAGSVYSEASVVKKMSSTRHEHNKSWCDIGSMGAMYATSVLSGYSIHGVYLFYSVE